MEDEEIGLGADYALCSFLISMVEGMTAFQVQVHAVCVVVTTGTGAFIRPMGTRLRTFAAFALIRFLKVTGSLGSWLSCS
jgi:hypothetical protein